MILKKELLTWRVVIKVTLYSHDHNTNHNSSIGAIEKKVV